MFFALSQPLQIEQVGGGFFGVSISSILLALAAVFAAGLAAWMARKNHAEQLAHDRTMRDISQARQSLSAAVETVADAFDSVTRLSGAVSEANARRQDVDEIEASTKEFLETFERHRHSLKYTRTDQQLEGGSLPLQQMRQKVAAEKEEDAVRFETEARERAAEAQDAYAPFASRLMMDTLRLRITIGNDSEVVRQQATLADAIMDWAERLNPDSDGRYRFETDPAQGGGLVGEQMEAFVAASQRWAADTAQS